MWQHINDQNQLAKIVDSSSDKYNQLYTSNSASALDKNSALLLRWLDVVRSWTCDENITEETRVDTPSFSKATKQTLLAIILNAIYLGLNHQMAETAEEISASTQCADSLPSDDVAMHRMRGWA